MSDKIESLDDFYTLEQSRLVKNFNKKKHSLFGDKHLFSKWYIEKLKTQNCKCFYCDTSIHDIRSLINAGLLKTRKVRGEGVRGPVLEIDKQGSKYIPDECVLACYYCNNDKSYTTAGEEYKIYFGKNRNTYFEHLLKEMPNSHEEENRKIELNK